MDSSDLSGLVNYFDEKVQRFDQLVPFARLCKYRINRRLEDTQMLDQSEPAGVDDLPDLGELTDLVIECKNALVALDETLVVKEAAMTEQHKTVLDLISDASSHLDHLSSNFPVDFGKPIEPSKPKYGIHVSKKPAVGRTGKTTGPTVNRTAITQGAPKPPQPTANEVTLNKKKGINSTTVTTLPVAKTQAKQQNKQQQQSARDQKAPIAKPDAAAKSGGISSRTTAATISSMQKSASKPVKSDIRKTTASLGMNDGAGKGPTIPVRLTKKLLTMREHQLNRMKTSEESEE